MKRGFEFSFGWLFSIIVGAVILFLAIYAANSLIRTERTVQDTERAQELEVILNPLSTSGESAQKPAMLEFPEETRITSRCDAIDDKQTISLASRSRLGKPWQEEGLANNIQTYLFSQEQIEGKKFTLFIKPFSLPYKVADLVFIWAGEYCFVNSPEDIRDEVGEGGLNISGIMLTERAGDCSKESVRVCFSGGESRACNISVFTDTGLVRKNGKNLYYEGPLLYGAIFGSTAGYECEVSRLMENAGRLAELYAGKSELIAGKSGGCSSSLSPSLKTYSRILANATSKELSYIKGYAEQLREQEEPLICRLWKES